MYKLLLFTGMLAIAAGVHAQDATGAYGYSFKAPAGAPATESERGPSGSIVLVKMHDDTYRFWLDVSKGWPSYANGETDGTITFKNDTASFDNTFESATGNCILRFRKNGNTITISGDSEAFNCGFGNGVSATGDYTKLEKQPLLDNNWLKKEYPNAPLFTIAGEKAELYQDENAVRPFPKRQFVYKASRRFNIMETESTIYTEYFQADGKFVYGWVRKTDVKPVIQ